MSRLETSEVGLFGEDLSVMLPIVFSSYLLI